MNVEQLLANPLIETFQLDEEAPTIEAAHDKAWLTLENAHRDIEGGEVAAWSLKVMQHVANGRGGVLFHAEFVRRPDEI